MIKPYLIAHRGASTQAPENTKESFLLAWEFGADGIEGDFRLTSDGAIVCFHDKETLRIANATIAIAQATLKQLKELDIGSWYHEKYAGSRVLTLSEVFAIVPDDKQIYVEIKTGIEILPALLKTINQSSLDKSQIKIISFQQEVIEAFKRKRTDIEAFWIVDFNAPQQVLSEDQVIEILNTIHADGLSANYLNLPEKFVRRITGQGFTFNAWAVDIYAEAVKLKEWGVTSISTNALNSLKNIRSLC